MEEKFIRHKVLPVDDAARKRVKELINKYAAKSEGHPYDNYGDEIVLEKYELSPIYGVFLHTQFDSRPVKDRQVPYKGGSVYARKYFRASDVNVWDFNLLTTDKFIHNGESFDVTGSHHVESCGRCSGSGKVICPSCGGSGDQQCSRCHGDGQIKRTRSEYRHTADKVYSDGHREPVYNYVDVTYYETCSICGGSGRVDCSRCGGRRKVDCSICEGYGRNDHYFSIDQQLDDVMLSDYFYGENVSKVQELVDGKKNYHGDRVFHAFQNSVGKGIFKEEPELAARLDSMIGSHAGRVGSNCHILFQEAEIWRIDAWWVQYEYKGRTYTGCISAADGKERFYALVSPITELADQWLKEADKLIGGVGTVKARKLLEKVDKLKVYGRTSRSYGIKTQVQEQLNKLYNMGKDLMFWLIALVGTPFIFNFYSELNPVMRYAHFINDPAWAPYSWVPVVQCILFLALLLGASIILSFRNHSKERHSTVFGYVASGLGLYLLIAIGILAVLVGLNYLGLSAVTSGIFYIAWRIIRLALIVLIFVIITIIGLAKWLFGLLIKLWHFIF